MDGDMSQEYNLAVRAAPSGDKVLLAIKWDWNEVRSPRFLAFRKVDGAEDVALDQEYGSWMFFDRPSEPGTYTYCVQMLSSDGEPLCESETTFVYEGPTPRVPPIRTPNKIVRALATKLNPKQVAEVKIMGHWRSVSCNRVVRVIKDQRSIEELIAALQLSEGYGPDPSNIRTPNRIVFYNRSGIALAVFRLPQGSIDMKYGSEVAAIVDACLKSES